MAFLNFLIVKHLTYAWVYPEKSLVANTIEELPKVTARATTGTISSKLRALKKRHITHGKLFVMSIICQKRIFENKNQLSSLLLQIISFG